MLSSVGQSPALGPWRRRDQSSRGSVEQGVIGSWTGPGAAAIRFVRPSDWHGRDASPGHVLVDVEDHISAVMLDHLADGRDSGLVEASRQDDRVDTLGARDTQWRKLRVFLFEIERAPQQLQGAVG
jgi:hypothetical protein